MVCRREYALVSDMRRFLAKVSWATSADLILWRAGFQAGAQRFLEEDSFT
jgi:hypothetical protein